jgi:membrane fusion protein (multidrug efflux system)
MISALAVLAGCSKSTTEAPHKQQVAEVGVFKVAPEALQITTELPGRTAAYQVAEVRPQVSGLIQKRLFVEGADVKAGVPLYQIDPATYQAAYNSAKAALAKAKANLPPPRRKWRATRTWWPSKA